MNFRSVWLAAFFSVQPGLQALPLFNLFHSKKKEPVVLEDQLCEQEQKNDAQDIIDDSYRTIFKRSFKIWIACKALAIPFRFLAYKSGLLKITHPYTARPARKSNGTLPLTAPIVAYACIGAPIIEEIVFRGWLEKGIDYLVTRCSPTAKKEKKNTGYTATLATSVLFGAVHYHKQHPELMIDTFAAGLVLSRAARKYGLKQSIATHMLNNVIVACFYYFL